eukprot:5473964-Prymnesium_polylepis.3
MERVDGSIKLRPCSPARRRAKAAFVGGHVVGRQAPHPAGCPPVAELLHPIGGGVREEGHSRGDVLRVVRRVHRLWVDELLLRLVDDGSRCDAHSVGERALRRRIVAALSLLCSILGGLVCAEEYPFALRLSSGASLRRICAASRAGSRRSPRPAPRVVRGSHPRILQSVLWVVEAAAKVSTELTIERVQPPKDSSPHLRLRAQMPDGQLRESRAGSGGGRRHALQPFFQHLHAHPLSDLDQPDAAQWHIRHRSIGGEISCCDKRVDPWYEDAQLLVTTGQQKVAPSLSRCRSDRIIHPILPPAAIRRCPRHLHEIFCTRAQVGSPRPLGHRHLAHPTAPIHQRRHVLDLLERRRPCRRVAMHVEVGRRDVRLVGGHKNGRRAVRGKGLTGRAVDGLANLPRLRLVDGERQAGHAPRMALEHARHDARQRLRSSARARG